jgi:hypothetical protein
MFKNKVKHTVTYEIHPKYFMDIEEMLSYFDPSNGKEQMLKKKAKKLRNRGIEPLAFRYPEQMSANGFCTGVERSTN